MRVAGHPGGRRGLARERDRRAARPVIGDAAPVVARRFETAHAEGREAVRRDHPPDLARAPVEALDIRPDLAPLLALDGVAPGEEVAEGPEGDRLGREEAPRAGEILSLDMLREAPEPRPDRLELRSLGTAHGCTSWDPAAPVSPQDAPLGPAAQSRGERAGSGLPCPGRR